MWFENNYTEGQDKAVWVTNGGIEVDFSVKVDTNDLCDAVPSVQWWKLVWFAQNIPKHSFILWLAIQDMLSTQDKFLKWVMHTINRFHLFLSDYEDIQHLFFNCSYSANIWNKLKDMAGINCDDSNLRILVDSLADGCVQ